VDYIFEKGKLKAAKKTCEIEKETDEGIPFVSGFSSELKLQQPLSRF